MENYKDQYDDSEFEMTYDDQAYYLPRLTLDRSKFEKGETIPVISIINHNLYNKGEEISKHDTVQTMKSAVCMNYGEPKPPIDSWTPQSDADRIFTHIRGAIIAPVHKIYRMPDNTQESLEFDYFSVTVRKSFNSSIKGAYLVSSTPNSMIILNISLVTDTVSLLNESVPLLK